MDHSNEDSIEAFTDSIQLAKCQLISFSFFIQSIDDLFETLHSNIHKLPWSAILNQMEQRLALHSLPSLKTIRRQFVYGDASNVLDSNSSSSILDVLDNVINEYKHHGIVNSSTTDKSLPIAKLSGNNSATSVPVLETTLRIQVPPEDQVNIKTVAIRSLTGLPRIPYQINNHRNKQDRGSNYNSNTTDAVSSSTTGSETQKMKSSSASWGQRKLLLMEIEFLTRYTSHHNSSTVIIYVGAAPGNHIPYLAGALFPHLTFILYDPAPFAFTTADDKKLKLKNVIIHNDFFRQEDIQQYIRSNSNNNKNNSSSNNNILFISDIRRLQHDEAIVREDLQLQSDWCTQLNATAAMLKFRLPYGCGRTVYLQGEVLLQPYIGPRSTEARLVVTPAPAAVTNAGANAIVASSNYVADTSTTSSSSSSSGIESVTIAELSPSDTMNNSNNDKHDSDYRHPPYHNMYPETEYDNLQYEEQFAYFNTHVRTAPHCHSVTHGLTAQPYFVTNNNTTALDGDGEGEDVTFTAASSPSQYIDTSNSSGSNSRLNNSTRISTLMTATNDRAGNSVNVYTANSTHHKTPSSSTSSSSSSTAARLLSVMKRFQAFNNINYNDDNSNNNRSNSGSSNLPHQQQSQQQQIFNRVGLVSPFIDGSFDNGNISSHNSSRWNNSSNDYHHDFSGNSTNTNSTNSTATNVYLTATGLNQSWDSVVELQILKEYLMYYYSNNIDSATDSKLPSLQQQQSYTNVHNNNINADEDDGISLLKRLFTSNSATIANTTTTTTTTNTTTSNDDVGFKSNIDTNNHLHSQQSPQKNDDDAEYYRHLCLGSLVISISDALCWLDSWATSAATAVVNEVGTEHHHQVKRQRTQELQKEEQQQVAIITSERNPNSATVIAVTAQNNSESNNNNNSTRKNYFIHLLTSSSSSTSTAPPSYAVVSLNPTTAVEVIIDEEERRGGGACWDF